MLNFDVNEQQQNLYKVLNFFLNFLRVCLNFEIRKFQCYFEQCLVYLREDLNREWFYYVFVRIVIVFLSILIIIYIYDGFVMGKLWDSLIFNFINFIILKLFYE